MAALDPNGPSEFDVARKRAAEQAKANQQQQMDAIKRRQAALGNLNSGAAIKQETLARNEGNKQLSTVNEGIDAAERQEYKRVREVGEARDFARGEREAGQQFAAEQAALARKLQERGLGLQEQQFGFQKESFGKQFGFQQKQANIANQRADQQFGLAKDQFERSNMESDREYEANRATNVLNAIFSAKNLKLPPAAIKAISEELIKDVPNFGNITSVLFEESPAKKPVTMGVPMNQRIPGVRYDNLGRPLDHRGRPMTMSRRP